MIEPVTKPINIPSAHTPAASRSSARTVLYQRRRRDRVALGLHEKGSAKLLAKVDSLLETIPVLPLDSPADAHYGAIRARLGAAGQTIGSNLGRNRCFKVVIPAQAGIF